MAVRQPPVDRSARRAWLVTASLLVLFVAALFLRAYWNVDAAMQDGQFVLSAGSDPYYHKRAIDHIQENGFQTLVHDPMLNYPYGAINPNPPLYQWSVAIAGKFLAPLFDATDTMSSEQVATWWAFLWSPAIYGALTLFPVYFIGKSLFSRKAGLLAALFWTFSTSSIDTTGLGSADHDAAVMFFASLAFLFYIKAIEQFRGDGNWVTNWRNGATIGPGLSRFFRDRRLGLLYSLLAGMGIAAVALVWKGFPYVLGIMFAYAGIQMVVDHWRNRDSLGVFVGTFIAMLVGTLVALPYYHVAEVGSFLRPVWFLVGGFAIAGLVLVPTRDLPTILVMPAALILALLGAVVAFFVAPDIANSLLYATVYFKQTALYETIAEAHPADFSTLVFSVGPVPYFLALFGFLVVLVTLRRWPGRAALFAVVWAAIAVFMATNAVRFVFNALPIICAFAGFGMAWVLDWLDFGSIRKSLAANQGNFWQGLRKGTRGTHVFAVILLALLLVVPNTLLAADAALPPQKELDLCLEAAGSDDQRAACTDANRYADGNFRQRFYTTRMGAFGQGFIADYWQDGLSWLDQHDANITNVEDRPGFLAWWDYGHWAIYIGQHPSVADNFQNGYVNAAYFLLAQNETHATQVMAGRLLTALPAAQAEQLVRDAGAEDPAAATRTLTALGCQHQDASCENGFVANLDLDESIALLLAAEQATGKSIRYFTTDVRMLPYDNPQTTQFIEQSSIFYAPVTLARENPDDYVTHQIQVGNRQLTQDEYRELARDPINKVLPSGERFAYQEAFFNSMYWRGYVGAPVEGPFPVTGEQVANAFPTPGAGLEHWRLVYENDGLKTLEFYRGAVVTGTVMEDGAPLANVTVTAFDDAGRILYDSISEAAQAQTTPDEFNVPHDSTTTSGDGTYRLIAPFAMPGGAVTIIATKTSTVDGQEVSTEVGRTTLEITREDAAAARAFTADVTVKLGAVEGVAFHDQDEDGTFDEGNDTLAEGVTVTVAGKSATTGADGRYNITGVSAGVQDVTAQGQNATINPRTDSVRVRPDETATHNVSLIPARAKLDGFAWVDADASGSREPGEGVGPLTLTFTPDANVTGNSARRATAPASTDGAYALELAPGTYFVTATTTRDGTTYSVNETLVLAPGEFRSGANFELVAQSA